MRTMLSTGLVVAGLVALALPAHAQDTAGSDELEFAGLSVRPLVNPDRVNANELRVLQAPACGTALATNGAIQYSDSAACSGVLAMAYCVPFDDECELTPVTLTLLQSQDMVASTSRAANPDGSPVLVDVIQMRAATQTPGAVVASRPARPWS